MWVGSVHEIPETRYVKVHCYVGRKFSWCVKLWSFLTTGSEKTTKLSESSTSIENAFDGSAAGVIHLKDQGYFSRMSMNYRFLWSTRFGFIMLYLNKTWGTPLKNLMVNHHFLKMARISSMTQNHGSVHFRFIGSWVRLDIQHIQPRLYSFIFPHLQSLLTEKEDGPMASDGPWNPWDLDPKNVMVNLGGKNIKVALKYLDDFWRFLW